MLKKSFEDELMSGMMQQMHKQASKKAPNLTKAAECLHSALEIFESAGLQTTADQIVNILEKIAQHNTFKHVDKMPSLKTLMEAGMTQSDLAECAKKNPEPKAMAKLNLTLRYLGLSDHSIGKLIGPTNVMSEEEAKELINPNSSFGKTLISKDYSNDLESLAKKKVKKHDKHIKGLTPEKQVKNLLDHGTPFNLADDNFAVPAYKSSLTKDDMDADFADMLDVQSFDINATDDELLSMDVKLDSLEVFDKDIVFEDFEDE